MGGVRVDQETPSHWCSHKTRAEHLLYIPFDLRIEGYFFNWSIKPCHTFLTLQNIIQE